MRSIHRVALGLAVVALGAIAGCATASVPVERLVSSEAAIRVASEVGAASTPQAALRLKLAREELADAKRLIAEDDNEAAALLLLRAEADADLAAALARQSESFSSAERAVQEAHAVKAVSP